MGSSKEKLFSFYQKLIENEKLGVLAYSGSLWKLFSILKNFLYRKKIFEPRAVDACVVSVGSIVAGGSGKTPFVILLAEMLKKSFRCAILSRGYGSSSENENILVKDDSSYLAAGDEPLLLKRSLGIPVAVGKNRFASFALLKNYGPQAVILDDGFQYRSLKKDFEIAILKGDDPFGKGRFLPAGFLRDSPGELKRADMIIFTGVEDEVHFASLGKQVRPFSNAPLAAVKTGFVGFYDLEGKRVGLKTRKAGAFAAIAYPQKFLRSLKEEGIESISEKFLFDHSPFPKEELESFALLCAEKGASFLICTEKDAVKIDKDIKLALPIYFLKIGLEIISGREEVEKLVAKISSKVNNYNNLILRQNEKLG